MSDWVRQWKAGALDLAAALARAKGRVTSLEAAVKAIRATAYADLRTDGKSQGDADQMSRLGEAHYEAVEEYAQAVEEHAALDLKVKIEFAAMDAWRSMEATSRAEMKLR